MRVLLDASSRRLIDMVELLFFRGDWITTGKLAAAIHASERTVAEDITRLRKRWGYCLDIESSTKKGIRMRSQNVSMIGRVFADIFSDSTALRWLEEIVRHPGQGIEFYEERLFVSRSTLLRLLPRINAYLAGKEIAVRHRSNRYQLVSKDEQYLRHFLACFAFEMYSLDMLEFHVGFNWKLLEEAVRRILRRYTPSQPADGCPAMDEISVLYHKMFYLVSLLRESQGFSVSSRYDKGDELSGEQLSYFLSSFPSLSESNLNPIHEYIALCHRGWESAGEETLIRREAAAFFDRLFEAVGGRPEEGVLRRLKHILCVSYLNAKYRTYSTSELFDRIYYFSVNVRKYNAPVYRIIEDGLRAFSEGIGVDMSERLPDLLFWICLEHPELTHYTPTKTALVISDFGMQHAEFLAVAISSFFNKGEKPSVNLRAVRYQDALDPSISGQCDIIITTIPSLPVSHPNILLINDYLTHDNLCDIYKAVTRSE